VRDLPGLKDLEGLFFSKPSRSMNPNKEIVVSGIRSTGYLHLGTYFGAIQNYVKMQSDYDCYFFVADYHSLTTHPDPKDLKANVLRVLAENIA
jgi:tryptophanyl-tRNA synthetase